MKRLVCAEKASWPASRILTRAPPPSRGQALADLETEHVEQDSGEPGQGNALDEAQVEHLGAQIGAPGRTRLQAFRRRRLEAPGAARADPAVKRHPCHVRHDPRYLDAVVSLPRRLDHARDIGAASAGAGEHVAFRRRVGMQGTMRPRMGLGLGLRLPRARRLLALRRRHARIARPLARLSDPGLEFGDPRRLPGDLRHQFLDPRHQRRDQRVPVDQFGWRRELSHTQVDSHPHPPRQTPQPNRVNLPQPKRSGDRGGVSNYPNQPTMCASGAPDAMSSPSPLRIYPV